VSLRAQAAADAATFIGDASGFGCAVTVTDPDGTSAEVMGRTTDIGQLIEVDTGAAIAGRQASVTFALSALTTAGLGVPKGVADEDSAPWIVSFADVTGTTHTFLVTDARPDAELGVIVCMLAAYEPTP
jgi:hypothetical protein